MPNRHVPTDGLVFAVLLDGEGGGRTMSWDEIHTWRPDDGFLWVHLHLGNPDGDRYVVETSGLDPLAIESLLAEETRPRCAAVGSGLIVNLRAVNLNPGADPEDMVSIRIYVDAERAISVRRRQVMAARDVRASLEARRGPTGAGGLLVALSEGVANRMADPISDIEESVDGLEDLVVSAESYELRTQLGLLRRQAIAIRRYLAPQRDVMNRLQAERPSWLDPRDQLHLREVGDRITRYIEDLDSARERAAVAQEELTNRLAEHMNKTMYQLAIVATIFLPLSLLTGLLGINVGGIPGADEPWAFWAVCGILLAMSLALYAIFRRRQLS